MYSMIQIKIEKVNNMSSYTHRNDALCKNVVCLTKNTSFFGFFFKTILLH